MRNDGSAIGSNARLMKIPPPLFGCLKSIPNNRFSWNSKGVQFGAKNKLSGQTNLNYEFFNIFDANWTFIRDLLVCMDFTPIVNAKSQVTCYLV